MDSTELSILVVAGRVFFYNRNFRFGYFRFGRLWFLLRLSILGLHSFLEFDLCCCCIGVCLIELVILGLPASLFDGMRGMNFTKFAILGLVGRGGCCLSEIDHFRPGRQWFLVRWIVFEGKASNLELFVGVWGLVECGQGPSWPKMVHFIEASK